MRQGKSFARSALTGDRRARSRRPISRWRRSPGRRTRHGSPSSAACSGSSRVSPGRPAYTVAAEPPLAWRPNGIFYSFEVALAGGSVRRFDPETGKTVQLTHLPPGHDAAFVAVSRDGTRVLYRLEVRDLPAGVRVVDGNGRQDRPVLACHGTNKPDVVRGSRLNDVIRVNGGGPDRVTCGPGEDVVYADRRDRVARDCERVKRSL